MTGGGEDPEADGQGHPVRAGQRQEVEAPGDEQAADDDHRIGQQHPEIERPPPEIERLDPGAAQDHEGQDQADVRRVEDVRPAVLDDVLGQQRDARHRGEDVPAEGVPRVVGRRADDSHDQGHAAAGEHRAGGPHERARLPEGEGDLDHRAGQHRGHDLGHGQLEAQHRLTQQVDGQDHRRDVEPRVADAGQDQGVRRPTQGQGSAGHVDSAAAAGRMAGRPISKHVLPGRELSSIVPPCWMTMLWLRWSPSPEPTPGGLVVKNGSKI